MTTRAREAAVPAVPLEDVKTLAAHLDVSVAWVYKHAAELGARRFAPGPKARLRFSVAQVDSRLTTGPASRESGSLEARVVEPQQRRRRSSGLEQCRSAAHSLVREAHREPAGGVDRT